MKQVNEDLGIAHPDPEKNGVGLPVVCSVVAQLIEKVAWTVAVTVSD